jgi:hypothetical protein
MGFLFLSQYRQQGHNAMMQWLYFHFWDVDNINSGVIYKVFFLIINARSGPFLFADRYVITPYTEYPQLLGLLLKLLNGELGWTTRREVLKVATCQLKCLAISF